MRRGGLTHATIEFQLFEQHFGHVGDICFLWHVLIRPKPCGFVAETHYTGSRDRPRKHVGIREPVDFFFGRPSPGPSSIRVGSDSMNCDDAAERQAICGSPGMRTDTYSIESSSLLVLAVSRPPGSTKMLIPEAMSSDVCASMIESSNL